MTLPVKLYFINESFLNYCNIFCIAVDLYSTHYILGIIYGYILNLNRYIKLYSCFKRWTLNVFYWDYKFCYGMRKRSLCSGTVIIICEYNAFFVLKFLCTTINIFCSFFKNPTTEVYSLSLILVINTNSVVVKFSCIIGINSNKNSIKLSEHVWMIHYIDTF